MPTTCAFGMKSMYGAALERSYSVFNKTTFVQGIGVDSDLHICLFSHIQTIVDRSGCGAPIFMQFQSQCACIDLFVQGSWQ